MTNEQIKQLLLETASTCKQSEGWMHLGAFGIALKAKGFENVANMEGGMNAWSENGLPTLAGGEKKACCANPNSKDCNPDGTCKKTAEKKACCANPNSKDCNPDGTCKKPADKK